MGRVPTRNKNLPEGMRARHRGDKTYYFLDTGARPRKEISLGQDYVLAIQKWAELTESKQTESITFRHVAERYQRERLIKKALATQEINLRELSNLYKFFDDPPVNINDITPLNVRQYLEWRVKFCIARLNDKNAIRNQKGLSLLPISPGSGEVPANREKALLSHIFNFAREKGFTDNTNPCSGIKGYREGGRDIYVDNSVLMAVWAAAEPHLRDAMDLAYLTGQRPADVRKMSKSDIKDGAVSVRQNKGGVKLRVAMEGEFLAVINRIQDGKKDGDALASKNGMRLTKWMMRGAFDRARAAAIEANPDLAEDIKAFQFRDLRAKAGTDTEEIRGLAAAKDQLGHTNETMTAHYVRHRRGKLVKPTK